MIIDPAQYAALIQQNRVLKALNDVLAHQNQLFLDQYLKEKQHKQTLIKQLNDFKQNIQLKHQQLVETYKQQMKNVTQEVQKKKQEETLFFEKKVAELQKGAFHKMKSLELQFKDHRLKSHLNDEFVTRLLKLYPGENNPGLPEFYKWVKKLATSRRPVKQELSIIVQSEKENAESMKSIKSGGKGSSTKSILKKTSKKSLSSAFKEEK